MQQLGPLALPLQGLGGRVVVEDRILVHQPLFEADASSFLQINGGYDDHGYLSFSRLLKNSHLAAVLENPLVRVRRSDCF